MVRYIDVPFNSAGFSTGVARMPAALGLGDVEVAVTVQPRRGPHGLLAEKGLVRMVVDVETAVRQSFADGVVPVLVGGDCPIMLGALAAMEDPGLVFLDGHEDSWQPTADVRGEASDSELGIAIGIVDGPVPAVVDRERVVVLGPRDADEIIGMAQQRIDTIVPLRDDAWLRVATADDLLEVSAGARDRPWWLHVDLDVLSNSALAAVDYPQPGGLSWSRLEKVVTTLVAEGGCRGASVGVYNPDLDEGASLPRVRSFVTTLARCLDSAS